MASRADARFRQDRDMLRQSKPFLRLARTGQGWWRRGRSTRRIFGGGRREKWRADKVLPRCAAASPNESRIYAPRSWRRKARRADRGGRLRQLACRAALAAPAVPPKQRMRPCPHAEWWLPRGAPALTRPHVSPEIAPASAWHQPTPRSVGEQPQAT